ncbi:hypothetical protein [Pyrobaculum aerophilum]|uniref:hypothetical protein n=1 Tax=Pyrobaculum aerophilum TaxID=13773 RepID=UPI0023F4CCEF|nr:hypothetical protein [Pyrobaculum aerophilum]MCX8136628.1 hypothetical protein [Pyrobaculum aerophilum]
MKFTKARPRRLRRWRRTPIVTTHGVSRVVFIKLKERVRNKACCKKLWTSARGLGMYKDGAIEELPSSSSNAPPLLTLRCAHAEISRREGGWADPVLPQRGFARPGSS